MKSHRYVSCDIFKAFGGGSQLLAASYRTTLHDITKDSISSQSPSTPITDFTYDYSPLPCTSREIPIPSRHCQLDTQYFTIQTYLCRTRTHTHETVRLPTDTLQNICEQDTKEEAEVGGDMKPVCACPG
jgi:hypothetical protein